jgi:short-subunit dehydrogenase
MIRHRDLQGAVVVIVGASSGIGRATAVAFAAHDARVVLAARSGEALREVERAIESRGAQALVVPTDIADAAEVERLGQQAVDRFGRIDVWVEVASVLVAGPFGTESIEEVRRLVDTNVLGTVLGARTALATFQAQGHGVLIIVGSLLGLVISPLMPLYSMSKFAARGLALNLRQAVAPYPDVHVSLVLPGPVDTPMFQRAANYTGRELRAIPPAYAPERIAATIVANARRPRRQATTGVISHLLLFSHRLAPRVTEWLVAWWSTSTVTRQTPVAPTAGKLFARSTSATMHGGWRRGRLRRRLGERLGVALAERRSS